MASFRSALCLVLASALPGALGAKQWCVRGDACWPTADDVAALEAALDPGARALKYDGQGNPRPCAVPIGSPGDQPLYGFGATSAGLKALYENETLGDGTSCMHTGEKRDVCVAATRDTPYTPNSEKLLRVCPFELQAEHAAQRVPEGRPAACCAPIQTDNLRVSTQVVGRRTKKRNSQTEFRLVRRS